MAHPSSETSVSSTEFMTLEARKEISVEDGEQGGVRARLPGGGLWPDGYLGNVVLECGWHSWGPSALTVLPLLTGYVVEGRGSDA